MVNDREFERLLDVLKEMNRNLERGIEKIDSSLDKISEELKNK